MINKYIDDDNRTLSERREHINIRMSAAYSCLGRNLSHINKQTPIGIKRGFEMMDKHCELD